MANEQRQTNRDALTDAIIEETAPEKTGTFCFDGFMWDKSKPVLRLMGDHGTPDFTLTFFEGGKVLVTPDSNPSWQRMLNGDFGDVRKLAKDILATMLVVNLVGVV